MTFGVHAGRISFDEMVRVCSTNTAKVFGLYPRKGTLAVGSDADLVLVDPDRDVTVSSAFYHGTTDWSVYDGWKLRGLPRLTVLRGQVVLDEFELVGSPGSGRYLVPTP